MLYLFENLLPDLDVEDQEEIVTFITNATESGGQLSEEDLETLRTKYGFPEEFLQRIIEAILAAQVKILFVVFINREPLFKTALRVGFCGNFAKYFLCTPRESIANISHAINIERCEIRKCPHPTFFS